MRRMMERLKLTVNEDKTHLCQLPQERFDFLGYTIGRCYSRKTGKAYLGTRPATKSVQRMVESVRQVTESKMTGLQAELIVKRLNQMLEGWANYFRLGQVSPAYQAIDRYPPRPRGGVAARQCRPRQPRPDQGHECDRALPHSRARRACRALLRAHGHRVQPTSTSSTRCPARSRTSRIRTGRSSTI